MRAHWDGGEAAQGGRAALLGHAPGRLRGALPLRAAHGALGAGRRGPPKAGSGPTAEIPTNSQRAGSARILRHSLSVCVSYVRRRTRRAFTRGAQWCRGRSGPPPSAPAPAPPPPLSLGEPARMPAACRQPACLRCSWGEWRPRCVRVRGKRDFPFSIQGRHSLHPASCGPPVICFAAAAAGGCGRGSIRVTRRSKGRGRRRGQQGKKTRLGAEGARRRARQGKGGLGQGRTKQRRRGAAVGDPPPQLLSSCQNQALPPAGERAVRQRPRRLKRRTSKRLSSAAS